MRRCVYCSGPVETLGTLGEIDYGRCRNCGAVLQSASCPEEPSPVDEDLEFELWREEQAEREHDEYYNEFIYED